MLKEERCVVRWIRGLIIGVLLTTVGCSKGTDKEAEATDDAVTPHSVEAMALVIDGPGSWSIKERGLDGGADKTLFVGSGKAGVILRHFRTKPLPESSEAARKRYGGGGKAKESKALKGGGYYLLVETDFKGTTIREVVSVLKDKSGQGHITCSAEVKADSDAAIYGGACQSLRLAK